MSPTNYVGGQRLTWTGNVGHRGTVAGPAVQHGQRHRRPLDHGRRLPLPHPARRQLLLHLPRAQHVQHPVPGEGRARTCLRPGCSTPRPGPHHPGDRAAGEQHQRSGPSGRRPAVRDHRRHHPGQHLPQPRVTGLPVFSGRTLTLQKRTDASTWRTLDTTTVGNDGRGYFSGLDEAAGVAVYRVRAENYFTDGNRIGWTQSFPLYVLAGLDAQDWYTSRYGVHAALVRAGGQGRQRRRTAADRQPALPVVPLAVRLRLGVRTVALEPSRSGYPDPGRLDGLLDRQWPGVQVQRWAGAGQQAVRRRGPRGLRHHPGHAARQRHDARSLGRPASGSGTPTNVADGPTRSSSSWSRPTLPTTTADATTSPSRASPRTPPRSGSGSALPSTRGAEPRPRRTSHWSGRTTSRSRWPRATSRGSSTAPPSGLSPAPQPSRASP